MSAGIKLVPKRKMVSGAEATPDMIQQEYLPQPPAEIDYSFIMELLEDFRESIAIPQIDYSIITDMFEHFKASIISETDSGYKHRLWVRFRLRIPVGGDMYD